MVFTNLEIAWNYSYTLNCLNILITAGCTKWNHKINDILDKLKIKI